MMRTYRTPKGTELPLLNLRGKEYLEVKYRLVWFREDHPDWAIETELLSVTQESAYARAVIKDNTGRVIATSHKFETKKGFPDFIEKAETGAIGRSLALIGYGTQFCADELDEGDRIVDAPVERQEARRAPAPAPAKRPEAPSLVAKPQAVATPNTQSPARPASPAAPVKPQAPARAMLAAMAPAAVAKSQPLEDDAFLDEEAEPLKASIPKEVGDYKITFGRKYKDMKLRDIPRAELEGYVEWLEENASKKNLPLSEEARFLKVAVERYLNAPAKH